MGRINSEAIPPKMCFLGWNGLAYQTGYVAARLRELQEEMRAEKRYDISDRLRGLHILLDNALGYMGVYYTEASPAEDGTK